MIIIMNTKMNEKNKKYKIVFVGLLVFFGFTLLAHTSFAAGVVPDCNTQVDASKTFKNPCDLDDFMQLINNVINFLLFDISLPIAAVLFAYGGFKLMLGSGDSGARSGVKKLLLNVVIGFIVALAAWLIVHVILFEFGYNGSWIGL